MSFLALLPRPKKDDHADADLLQQLDDALAPGYEGFGFRRKAEVRDLENGAIRVEIAVDYRGGS